MKKAVFLDRDGVINESVVRNGKPYPPTNLEELRIVDGGQSALENLKNAGYLLIGITNQPDVARGTTTKESVLAINQALIEQLPLEEIRVCFHDNPDNCHCRKPKPGLILEAVKDYQIDLNSSFMIGDRWKDIEAGHLAGCQTIWIDCQYDEPSPSNPPTHTTTNLNEAANWILTKGDAHEKCR